MTFRGTLLSSLIMCLVFLDAGASIGSKPGRLVPLVDGCVVAGGNSHRGGSPVGRDLGPGMETKMETSMVQGIARECFSCKSTNVTRGAASPEGVWTHFYCRMCASPSRMQARNDTRTTLYTRYRCGDCTRVAAFGRHIGSMLLHCSLHKVPGERDVRHNQCIAIEGCERRATFGDGKVQTFCAMHRPDTSVSMGRRTCIAPDCLRRALFGNTTCGKPVSCGRHKCAGDVNLGTRYLGDRRCLEEGCSKLASYGEVDVRIPRYCRSHKGEKHIDVVNKLCEAKGGCGKQAFFGDKQERRARFCAKHRPPGHVQVRGGKHLSAQKHGAGWGGKGPEGRAHEWGKANPERAGGQQTYRVESLGAPE